jgi:hypothetical protein
MKRKLRVSLKSEVLTIAQSLTFRMYETQPTREDFYKILHWEMEIENRPM